MYNSVHEWIPSVSMLLMTEQVTIVLYVVGDPSNNWAYSRIHHIARSCYQNEAITANNTVKKEECIVMYCCVHDQAH